MNKSLDAESVGLWSAQSFVLLVILPYCNIVAFLWCYTALPLKFLDENWPIWQLSVIFTLIYIPRVAVQLVTRIAGDWVCVPMSIAAACSNLGLATYPNNIAAVCIALASTCAALNPTAYRGLVHAKYMNSGENQVKRALRVFTAADTLGYACAPFIGGVLYDSGGIRSCAFFAASCTALCALLPLCLKIYWQSVKDWWRDCKKSTVNVASNNEPEDEHASGTLGAENGHSMAGHIPAHSYAPVVVILSAVFGNILTYAVEWCLYAIYFRLRYGWSGAWCGFAQMIGDLLGASVLAASAAFNLPGSLQLLCSPPARFNVFFKPPYLISSLAFCHCILMMMLAQNNFVVALLGQILMGTVYVFFEQALQELILLYSGGNNVLYRHLLSQHYIVFTAGCALCSPLAYGIYLASGFEATFYATSGIIFCVGTASAIFYWFRLRSTTVGVLGSLELAEEEIRRRYERVGPKSAF